MTKIITFQYQLLLLRLEQMLIFFAPHLQVCDLKLLHRLYHLLILILGAAAVLELWGI